MNLGMRFSTRTFLALFAILAVLLVIWTNRSRTQDNAVKRLQALGGSVEYQRVLPDLEPWIDRNYTSSVRAVRFYNQENVSPRPIHVTDYDKVVTELRNFSSIKTIHVYSGNHGRWVEKLRAAFPGVSIKVHQGGVI